MGANMRSTWLDSKRFGLILSTRCVVGLVSKNFRTSPAGLRPGETSGSNLTFESEAGFPPHWSRASLAHANRNFHHSQAQ